MTSEPAAKFSQKTGSYVWVWLPGETDPVVAGQIVDRGESMDFYYGRSYLALDHAISLYEPELPLRSGSITPEPPLRYANALRDAAPDAWGRRVIINRLTGATGQAADNAMQDLGELTFLLHSGSDRTGALDFQDSPMDYQARQSETASLDTLVRAAEMVEQGIPLEPVLADALQHGTAIGGARPKALIADGARKYVAKFSSSGDTYNVVKAEYVAMRLAAIAGLDVAPVTLVRAMDRDVLLIERFDRYKTEGGWARRAMVSGLTLLGLDALMAAQSSYEDLTV
ncbi:MAG: type II toxin-antitoxin system HipA family toxin, partial [Proteobacteria bacterium]|nr:type II toxin-antitoxin system HipA family toxin [Pseudomonadota bacterium]